DLVGVRGRPLDDDVLRQVERIRLAGREYKFVPETRCRVCQDESSRTLVNRLLSLGLTYQGIVNALEPINAAHLQAAHRQLESGTTVGKLVLSGWA
nr:hypothetical protein [Vulcanococcus sp.]